VPLATVKVHSYIGYAGQWYYDTECSLPPEGLADWAVQWTFDDGSTFTGNTCRRIIPGSAPRMVTLSLTRGDQVLRGSRRITFGGDIRMANVNDAADTAWYVELLKRETPSPLSNTLRPDLLFLGDFGDLETFGKFAGAWLKANPGSNNPFWIAAEIAWLRLLAQSDPQKALTELDALSPETQRDYAVLLDPLELEFLVFYRRDARSEDRIRQIALKNIRSPIERMADVRLGDLYRLSGKYKEAAGQYLAIQKTVVDESESRKLPAQDRAYSITINDLIRGGSRVEAGQKLQEWDSRHPMAKLDTDFLLLRARTLMLFGRWKEALTEIESFEKMQTDSPYEIDAEFYRARVYYETGQKDEARKIWTGLAKDYPKSELAGQSSAWAAKP
jgi:tetratricopeptide (TPR) repeat protein